MTLNHSPLLSDDPRLGSVHRRQGRPTTTLLGYLRLKTTENPMSMTISLHIRMMVKYFIPESSCLTGSHQRQYGKVAMSPLFLRIPPVAMKMSKLHLSAILKISKRDKTPLTSHWKGFRGCIIRVRLRKTMALLMRPSTAKDKHSTLPGTNHQSNPSNPRK